MRRGHCSPCIIQARVLYQLFSLARTAETIVSDHFGFAADQILSVGVGASIARASVARDQRRLYVATAMAASRVVPKRPRYVMTSYIMHAREKTKESLRQRAA
jgi:hypothetical protein